METSPTTYWLFRILSICWVRLFLLIVAMIIYSFGLAKLIDKQYAVSKARVVLFFVSAFTSLPPLISFKYHLGSFVFLSKMNYQNVKEIMLPLGISYFSFQILSFLIKVNIGAIQPGSLIGYANYILFFPKVSLGPVMEPEAFKREVTKPSIFSYEKTTKGLKRILWGAFKKIVLADSLGHVTGYVFPNYQFLHPISLVIGIACYMLQLYADFSGYTDMAIGLAQMLGINLPENFNKPFLSTSVTSYWRRWHLSLFNWFYSYIYNPIVFSFRKWQKTGILLALFLTFSVSGIWHGNTVNFWLWGILQGLAISFEMFTTNIRKQLANYLGANTFTAFAYLATFSYLGITVIFFVMPDLENALHYLSKIVQVNSWNMNNNFYALLIEDIFLKKGVSNALLILSILSFVISIHLWRGNNKLEDKLATVPRLISWPIYMLLAFAILYCSFGNDSNNFLYRNF